MARARKTVCNYRIGSSGAWLSPGKLQGANDGVPEAWVRIDENSDLTTNVLRDIPATPDLDVIVTAETLPLIEAALDETDDINLQIGNSAWHRVMAECAVDECRFTWTANEELRCRMTFAALGFTTVASGAAQTASTADPFPSRLAVVQMDIGAGLVDVGARGLDVARQNNVVAVSTGDDRSARVAGQERWANEHDRGPVDCSATATIRETIATLLELTSAPHDIGFTAAFLTPGGDSIELALTNLGYNGPSLGVRAPESGYLEFEFPFHTNRNSLAVTVAAAV